MSGILHIVGTPIGNLGDMSQRAVDTLREADIVAAEDTRSARKLLTHFDIRGKELASLHEYSSTRRVEELADQLEAGKDIALVSDAGMPLISDPGYAIVAECCRRDIPVGVIPGPSALTAVIALSGIDCRRFVFGGFLASKRTARRRELVQLCGSNLPVVLYESPKRIVDLLDDVCETLSPDTPVCVAREITKRHETTLRGSAADVAATLRAGEPLGEFSVVVDARVDRKEMEDDDIREKISDLIAEGMTNRDAARYAATVFGVPKKRAYEILLAMERNEPDEEEDD